MIIVMLSKGAVVSWWNMDKNGGYDIMTKHGGCPVVIGSKWITNKWEALLSVFKADFHFCLAKISSPNFK